MVQSGVNVLLNTISFIYMTLMSEKITLLPQCLPPPYLENRLAPWKHASVLACIIQASSRSLLKVQSESCYPPLC